MFEFLKRKTVTPVEMPAEVAPIAAVKAKGKIFIAEKSSGLLPAFAFAKKNKASKQVIEPTTKWLNTHNLVSSTCENCLVFW